MLTTKPKETSLLAQMIAQRQGCVICKAKPTVYAVAMKGFCGKHKAEAEAERKKNYFAFVAEQDVDTARIHDQRAILDKKRVQKKIHFA